MEESAVSSGRTHMIFTWWGVLTFFFWACSSALDSAGIDRGGVLIIVGGRKRLEKMYNITYLGEGG